MFNSKVLLLFTAILPLLAKADGQRYADQSGKFSNDDHRNANQQQVLNLKHAAADQGKQSGGIKTKGVQNGHGQLAASGFTKSRGNGQKYSSFGGNGIGSSSKSGTLAHRTKQGQNRHVISANKHLSSKSGNSSESTSNKEHKKDYVLSDSIHYGFDKKFNQEEDEDGIYKLKKHSDANQLANSHNKHKKYKLHRGKAGKHSSSIGSQRGVKEGSAHEQSGDDSMQMGDYFNNKNKRSQDGKRSSIFGSKFDYKAGGKRYALKNGDVLGRNNSSYNIKSSNAGSGVTRVGAQAHIGARAIGKKNKGLANYQGQQNDGFLTGQAYQSFGSNGIGSARSLGKEDKQFKSNDENAFSKSNNQKDGRRGKSQSSNSHNDEVKRNHHKQNARNFKTAGSRSYADATKYYKDDDTSNSKYKDVYGDENVDKKFEKKVNNDKVSKVFHTSKKIKGDNYERLDFDRKKLEKDNAHDSQDRHSDADAYSNNNRKTHSNGTHYNHDNAQFGAVSGHKDSMKRVQGDRKEGKLSSAENIFGVQRKGDQSFGHFGQGFNNFDEKFKEANSGSSGHKQNTSSSIADNGDNFGHDHFTFQNPHFDDVQQKQSNKLRPQTYVSADPEPQGNTFQFGHAIRNIAHEKNRATNFQIHGFNENRQAAPHPLTRTNYFRRPTNSKRPTKRPYERYLSNYGGEPIIQGTHVRQFRGHQGASQPRHVQDRIHHQIHPMSPQQLHNGNHQYQTESRYQPNNNRETAPTHISSQYVNNNINNQPLGTSFHIPSYGIPSQNFGNSYSNFHNPNYSGYANHQGLGGRGAQEPHQEQQQQQQQQRPYSQRSRQPSNYQEDSRVYPTRRHKPFREYTTQQRHQQPPQKQSVPNYTKDDHVAPHQTVEETLSVSNIFSERIFAPGNFFRGFAK